MTRQAWLFVIVWWAVVIPLTVWGLPSALPYIDQYAHTSAVWVADVLNSWGLNVELNK